MPTWESRYALAVTNAAGAFLGFVPGPRTGTVQLPVEAAKFSLPADARIAAAEASRRSGSDRVVPWDLLLQAPLKGED